MKESVMMSYYKRVWLIVLLGVSVNIMGGNNNIVTGSAGLYSGVVSVSPAIAMGQLYGNLDSQENSILNNCFNQYPLQRYGIGGDCYCLAYHEYDHGSCSGKGPL